MLCNCSKNVRVPLCTNTLNIGQLIHDCKTISDFLKNSSFDVEGDLPFGGKNWVSSGTGSWLQSFGDADGLTAAGETATLTQTLIEKLTPNKDYQFNISTVIISGQLDLILVDVDGNRFTTKSFTGGGSFTFDLDFGTLDKDIDKIELFITENTNLEINSIQIVDASECNEIEVVITNRYNNHSISCPVVTVGTSFDILVDLELISATFFQTDFSYKIEVFHDGEKSSFINNFNTIDCLVVVFYNLFDKAQDIVSTPYHIVKTTGDDFTAVSPLVWWDSESIEVEGLDNNDVARLKAKAGSNPMEQGSTIAQPALSLDVNGKPESIVFDTDSEMKASNVAYDREYLKTFMLIRPIEATPYKVLFQHGLSGANDRWAIYINSDDLTYGFEINNDTLGTYSYRQGVYKDIIDNWVLIEWEYDKGEIKLFIDGSEILVMTQETGSSDFIINPLPDITDVFQLGNNANFNFKEIKIFNSKLSDEQTAEERRVMYKKINK